MVNTGVNVECGKTSPVDTLASRLKTAREQSGLSQTELAKKAQLSQSTVGNIEAGIRAGAQSLAALAIALGVRYQWLRDGELPMKAQAEAASAWPFQRLTPERWAELDSYARAAMEEAALSKLRELTQEREATAQDASRKRAAPG